MSFNESVMNSIIKPRSKKVTNMPTNIRVSQGHIRNKQRKRVWRNAQTQCMLFCQYAHFVNLHMMNTRMEHVLSTRAFNTCFQHVLSTRAFNTCLPCEIFCSALFHTVVCHSVTPRQVERHHVRPAAIRHLHSKPWYGKTHHLKQISVAILRSSEK